MEDILVNEFGDADCEDQDDENLFRKTKFRLKFFDREEGKVKIFKDIRSEEQKLTCLGKLKGNHAGETPGEKTDSRFSSQEIAPS